ncbi:peptide deformylase [Candidatus Nomurabacteria bacterium]|nr:peptide deformylase [Candidatus Nomurabacteria bacterium]
MKSIVQKDTVEGEALRKISNAVELSEIETDKIQNILKEMHQSLASQNDGVALAAPQIGVNLRIFVVAPKVFAKDPDNMRLVFINPEIIKHSKDEKLLDEGCLSVRWWYGKTRRHSRATVKAYGENAEEFQMSASGLLAQIFQHEIDHLNGILFVDHAVELEEMESKES